jgi:hypothetical protein
MSDFTTIAIGVTGIAGTLAAMVVGTVVAVQLHIDGVRAECDRKLSEKDVIIEQDRRERIEWNDERADLLAGRRSDQMLVRTLSATLETTSRRLDAIEAQLDPIYGSASPATPTPFPSLHAGGSYPSSPAVTSVGTATIQRHSARRHAVDASPDSVWAAAGITSKPCGAWTRIRGRCDGAPADDRVASR